MKKIFFLIITFISVNIFGQKKYEKMPVPLFISLYEQINSMDINDMREFKHATIPMSKVYKYNSFIKDSIVGNLDINAKSYIYYSWQMTNGDFIVGDIYFSKNDNNYIKITTPTKTYYNFFFKQGEPELRRLFPE